MEQLTLIAKALGDPARVRAVLSPAGGGLSVCQAIELPGLSPATVSRHMEVLRRHAGTRPAAGSWCSTGRRPGPRCSAGCPMPAPSAAACARGGVDASGRELGLSAMSNRSQGAFAFDAGAIGTLPTFAGLVITSAHGNYTLEAFNAQEQSMGSTTLLVESPGPAVFVGVGDAGGTASTGLSSVDAWFDTGVDHVQYGTGMIPEPASAAVLALASAGLLCSGTTTERPARGERPGPRGHPQSRQLRMVWALKRNDSSPP